MVCSAYSTWTLLNLFIVSKYQRARSTLSPLTNQVNGLLWLVANSVSSSFGSGNLKLVSYQNSLSFLLLDVLKQQGHNFDLSTLAYSPDGAYIATGGDDGKLKLWTTKNHLSFVTFTEHTSQITDIKFVPKKGGNTVVSCSKDGTVRAYDLVKYRNFRVMVANKPTQFNSLAIDSSGDIIVAGAIDPFNIYVWSLRTGQLVDVLNGHTAPISSLCFSPSGVRFVTF